MRTSTARKALTAALAAATSPAEKADIANKLSLLTERESRTSGRRLRMRAKAKQQAEAAPQPPVDDGAELFIMDWPANPPPITQTAPTPEPRQEVQPAEPAPTTTVTRRVLPVSGTGFTRTTPTFEPAVFWDERERGWFGHTADGVVRARRPDFSYSEDAPELYHKLTATGSLAFAGGEWVDPEAEQKAKDAEIKAYGEARGWR